MDSVLKQELLDDRFYNNDTFKSGVPVNGSDAQNDAATTIQAGFKGEATRQGKQPAFLFLFECVYCVDVFVPCLCKSI